MFATSCIVVLVVSVILVSGSPVGLPKDRQDVELGLGSQVGRKGGSSVALDMGSQEGKKDGSSEAAYLGSQEVHKGGSSEAADDPHQHRNNVLDHILHEIEKGHVTSHSMSHWQEQITHGLNDGSLTQEEVNVFMAALHLKVPVLGTGDECCMFG